MSLVRVVNFFLYRSEQGISKFWDLSLYKLSSERKIKSATKHSVKEYFSLRQFFCRWSCGYASDKNFSHLPHSQSATLLLLSENIILLPITWVFKIVKMVCAVQNGISPKKGNILSGCDKHKQKKIIWIWIFLKNRSLKVISLTSYQISRF